MSSSATEAMRDVAKEFKDRAQRMAETEELLRDPDAAYVVVCDNEDTRDVIVRIDRTGLSDIEISQEALDFYTPDELSVIITSTIGFGFREYEDLLANTHYDTQTAN